MGNMTCEEKMKRLEESVAKLEMGDALLGESLQLFEEGTGLVGDCRRELESAEQQVVKLMKGADGAPVETNFLDEEA